MHRQKYFVISFISSLLIRNCCFKDKLKKRLTSASNLLRRISSFAKCIYPFSHLSSWCYCPNGRMELIWRTFCLAVLPNNCSIFANVDFNPVTCLTVLSHHRRILNCGAFQDTFYMTVASVCIASLTEFVMHYSKMGRESTMIRNNNFISGFIAVKEIFRLIQVFSYIRYIRYI